MYEIRVYPLKFLENRFSRLAFVWFGELAMRGSVLLKREAVAPEIGALGECNRFGVRLVQGGSAA